jgi:hypothetical protein
VIVSDPVVWQPDHNAAISGWPTVRADDQFAAPVDAVADPPSADFPV